MVFNIFFCISRLLLFIETIRRLLSNLDTKYGEAKPKMLWHKCEKRIALVFTFLCDTDYLLWICHMGRRKKWFRLQMENNFLQKMLKMTCDRAYSALVCTVYTERLRERNRSNQRIETEGDADGHDWVALAGAWSSKASAWIQHESSFIISQECVSIGFSTFCFIELSYNSCAFFFHFFIVFSVGHSAFFSFKRKRIISFPLFCAHDHDADVRFDLFLLMCVCVLWFKSWIICLFCLCFF